MCVCVCVCVCVCFMYVISDIAHCKILIMFLAKSNIMYLPINSLFFLTIFMYIKKNKKRIKTPI